MGGVGLTPGRFALKNKVPRGARRLVDEGRKDFVEKAVDVLLNMFGIGHVGDTIVGDS